DFSSLRSHHWYYLRVPLPPSLHPRRWRVHDANWIVSIVHGALWAPRIAAVWKPVWISIASTKPARRLRNEGARVSHDLVQKHRPCLAWLLCPLPRRERVRVRGFGA